MRQIGVRDLVARGYSIPGRMSQRGGGRAPAFRVARCRTRSGVRLDGLGWFPLGPIRVRLGPTWSRIGPYISRTLIRDSRVFCQGSTGRSTVPYRCTIDVRTPWARHGVPTGPPEAGRYLTDPRRTPGGTVGPRLIGASEVWAARSSCWRSQCTCMS